MTSVLSIQGAVAGYATGNVLHGVGVEVAEGEAVAVVGRNGVGKTTLMRTAIGQLPLRAGSIAFKGTDITAEPADRRARRGIGYVPQGRGIFPHLTVRENLLMGGFINEARRNPDFELVFGYFPFLRERLGQRGATLSGGQQAMLAIGRALINEPALLLLDEPSDGVQPSIIEEIGEILSDLNRTRGISVLLVEQNIGFMQRVAGRAYTLDKGRVTSELGPEEIADERLLAEHIAV
ncbi:amino acid/amide ABC transporter ATP-binding protein 2, HAAT family [Tistlia consotensis]|uniref:Amino acid/amide ABC transporter ATP-binding protein 2, HAAT family n=1 Tax=Tistlia consotensis USBA 355 TaxID=560819 RepID=A0A1Y6CGF0_9PROT|nr:ABC transporter ATP-binding protein [Tistlia consotensis]SMF63860.1 amino acid/amide ABC transporter ATP-binding protein 2, HAAT family [Tistlia consotensis USBA 355]SNR98352.1 amino acid/amide ABC transporter ATP-binding protein 2, HAAT family [Tistlia consotensis]